tara:strand:- start:6614 stop:9220 length:2607 start_codon:yes stop_codon:yes gene_type:complete
VQYLLNRIQDWLETVPEQSVRWRWLILLVLISSLGLSIWGVMTRMTLDMSPEVWFAEDAQPVLVRNAFRHQFGSDEDIFIAYKPKSGDVFSADALQTLVQLHRDIENKSAAITLADGSSNPFNRIIRIDSLYNARYQIADGDTLISRPLIGHDFPRTEAEREARRDIALGQKSFERMFFSPDFTTAGIRLKTNLGAMLKSDGLSEEVASDDLLSSGDFMLDIGAMDAPSVDAAPEAAKFLEEQVLNYAQVVRAIRESLEDPKYADFEFHIAGSPSLMEFSMNSMEQASGLISLMILLIIVLSWLSFRSFSAVVWPLSIVCISVVWAVGLGCWLGLSYTAVLALTVMLVIAVGVASCIHVLNAYLLLRQESHSHERAMALCYRQTGTPILLTSLTTMIGMLSLTLADMPIMEVFGMVSAFAVLFSVLLVLFLLPLMLHIWRPTHRIAVARARQSKIQRIFNIEAFLGKVAEFTERFSKPIVIIYVAAFILLIYGGTKVAIDSNYAEQAREGTDLRNAMNVVDEKLMGGMALEIYLNFNHRDALKDPVVLKAMDEWVNDLKRDYPDKIVKTFSLADVVKDSNKVMNQGDPKFEVIPDDPRMAAQLLYLFDSANSADRRAVVSDDYSHGHISFMLRNAGSYEYTDMFERINDDIANHFPQLHERYPDMEMKVTGSFHLIMALFDLVITTQLKSFGFALIAISVVMMISLGSIQSGLISTLPNLMPAAFTFGILGWLGVSLNADTLVIAPIILGIAVDDTIHFISHYRESWIKHGDVRKAMHETLREVGQAVIFTTLILGFGFGVLIFSSNMGLAKPGALGSAAIFVALLSDLLFLPALIYWFKPELGRDKALQIRRSAQTHLGTLESGGSQ